ncbi:hypothetical protein HEP87_28115 [Streptomyces sp. S1D4-11]|nr:hypothetical protein [Streptomyces sp. S1D4-11]
MGVVLVALLLIVGAVAAVVFQRRSSQPYGAVSDLDAEAEAHRWVERLGGSLSTLDARGNAAAAQALTDAAERHRAAQGQLVTARSGAQYAMASQTALEGLHYIRAARTSLGLDPGPALPDLGTGSVTARDGRVTIDGRTYAASPRPGDATPYYYPGGVVGGRRMPGGWYSAPWWKTALVMARPEPWGDPGRRPPRRPPPPARGRPDGRAWRIRRAGRPGGLRRALLKVRRRSGSGRLLPDRLRFRRTGPRLWWRSGTGRTRA